jgi:hypothetical protein
MSEDFKPGEIVVCLGLPDSYLYAGTLLSTTSGRSAEFVESFSAGTEVRILKRLVSGNYFVERYRSPHFRVRLSPENLKRRDDEANRCINLAGVEMEGGFKRSDVVITAMSHGFKRNSI